MRPESGSSIASPEPGHTLFAELDWTVLDHQRVGLVGPNGSGKSSLLRLIAGDIAPDRGEIHRRRGSSVDYLPQSVAFEPRATLIERAMRMPPALPMTEGAGVAMLLKYLFRYDQVRQPIGVLSGGERSRLQLARLVLERPNLLLLDEPTNNLDIPSAEVLEGALDDFEGSLLVVSHDRYFLDRVVDRVIDLSTGSLVGFDGGYTDFVVASAESRAAEG